MVFLRTHQPYSGTEVLMETKLERIAEISAHSPRPEFTSLYHLINKEMLLQCHKELDGSKAVGIDEITNCKKLIAYKSVYRIRIGDYRAFFIFHVKIVDDTVKFEYLVSRGEAYDKKVQSELRKKDK